MYFTRLYVNSGPIVQSNICNYTIAEIQFSAKCFWLFEEVCSIELLLLLDFTLYASCDLKHTHIYIIAIIFSGDNSAI